MSSDIFDIVSEISLVPSGPILFVLFKIFFNNFPLNNYIIVVNKITRDLNRGFITWLASSNFQRDIYYLIILLDFHLSEDKKFDIAQKLEKIYCRLRFNEVS